MTSEYLTTEQVCGKLSAAGVDEATVGKVFSARLQPQNLDDPERKFVMGVQSGDVAYLIVYRFGTGEPLFANSPLDEKGPDWRPRWISVEGPFGTDEAMERAKELSSG